MRLPYELHLAHRNLTRHPGHTAAMIGGLGLAVLVMVYIPSTMSSFYNDLIDRSIEQNSAHVTIWPMEKSRGQMDYALRNRYGHSAVLAFTDRTFPRHRNLTGRHALSAQASKTSGVVAVASFVKEDATISRGNVNLGAVIEGIEPKQYSRVVNIASHFPQKRIPKLGPSDIAIGFRMAEKLGIHTGEHIHIATPKTRRLMRVKAIFRSGYYDKDMHHGFVSLRTAQRMFGMGNEVSALAVRCRDIEEAGTVSSALEGRMNNKVRDWMDDNASLLAEIATVNRVTLFINVLVALVASVGMANVFSMFVFNRQKELAILRAVGASKASLKTILLLEAMFIWFIGTIIGCTLVLGVMAYEQEHPYTVSEETYGIGSYATHPIPEAFVVACALAAIMMVGSALWSGRRAAKLNPAEVIFGR
jgi:lipoprotein-releasing system permease protein